MKNLSPRINAGAVILVASHLLSGVGDSMPSETDTVISACLLAIALLFFVLAIDGGEATSQNFAAVSCSFSIHALLEASIFTNTFVWVATGVGRLTLVGCVEAGDGFGYQKFTTGRLWMEAASTYAVALVSFVTDEYAVLTRSLGVLLAVSSLLVLVAIMAPKRANLDYGFVLCGNRFAFGAAVIAHAAYYVLLKEKDKTTYAAFVAFAVAVGLSTYGKQDN